MAGHTEEHDAVTGRTTTGHEWDGIKELNTPLPRWWLNVFYATIIWSIGYFIAYPAWPGVSSYTRGVLGYSSRADVAVEVEALKARRAAQAADLATVELAAIKADPKLLSLAIAQGKAAFGDNCAPCHGIGATGSKGYPNLNDDEWLWGGTLEDIHTTLKHGIRSSNDADTRISAMPAFGRDGILKRDEIRMVANHVRALSGQPTEAGYNRAAGEKLFADNCASCHGEKGLGNRDLGAPNLADAISLYGNRLEDIVETVTNSRAGVMPAWAGRLDPVTVKSLAVYVHSLGGGQ
ncbi:MAG: cytochrome-c oxidase, cbb3-type subunit III [Hyphomicrobiales bacterium]|uniref:cytochrome-c oxidase, cbb3-type subunit III n=1 Tax=Rhabdaerophilum calidifontis TaxID=2604328 RepID=UPI00123C15E2|nr:cytochrome-c oxidase, cbb3-type subunit III [Rhabdaerophilum calidifontis]MCA1953129.1 cytochrome-c oxidase, cbb3-type subunit III [Hyphomicrobiales bacterium]MCA1999301.1 cytochrome-c oxidase, cbb3-type subunit III [Hyphomicrobiales bacterium]